MSEESSTGGPANLAEIREQLLRMGEEDDLPE
jgi:hypothetical protein